MLNDQNIVLYPMSQNSTDFLKVAEWLCGFANRDELSGLWNTIL